MMRPGDLLSGDFPRSPVLAVILVLIVAGLALAPFVFPGTRSVDAAAKIAVFILLVASYDLLLGYTGIVSFAHTMFFGIGGYGIAIAMAKLEPGWGSMAFGAACALAVSVILSFCIGLFSLRVKAIFFAMITLAVAAFFNILASQFSDFTGGEEGINFTVPELMRSGTHFFEDPLAGVVIGGKLLTYYFVFFGVAILFLLLLRIVNSPFGRVLLAIRENDFRAEALGYRTVIYRTIANCLGAAAATLAGVLYALWTRHTDPSTMLGFDIMVDILLMVVIGGMGTMYGAIIGATLLLVAKTYLPDAIAWMSDASSRLSETMGLGDSQQPVFHSLGQYPVLQSLFSSDRWLLWLGVLFVLSVYYFPFGVVGKLRMMAAGIKPKT